MMNKGLITSSPLLSVSLLPFTSQNIRAYIDPGTGSLIIQVLIASFVGALFIIKVGNCISHIPIRSVCDEFCGSHFSQSQTTGSS